MHSEARQLLGFMMSLAANPRDVDTRRIFADWLDDHDEPELADQQRQWSLKRYDAEQYLAYFCRQYQAEPKKLLEEIAVEGGYGEYCFGSEGGPRNIGWDDELREAVSVLLNKEITAEHIQRMTFHCAC